MSISLNPIPPYDFHLSASIFSRGDLKVRSYRDGVFRQVIRVGEKLSLITVKSSGTLDRPELELKLRSDAPINDGDEKNAADLVRSMFNLRLDLKPFYGLARSDNVMSILTLKLKGLKSPVTPTVYEALVDSIVEQQISLAVARVIQVRLIKSFGDFLKIDGTTFYAFPTPARLASADIESLRKCGLSQKKAEYIREISQMISCNRLDLEKFKKYNDIDRIVLEMDEIRGIGPWTAELTAIRGLGRLEAFPADDLGLRKIISHYYFEGTGISSADARRVASNWGDWKGLAAYYLIIASSMGIETTSERKTE